MAGFALVTQSSLVRIVLAMTCSTIGGCLGLVWGSAMTGITLDGPMPVSKNIVGVAIMIELWRLPARLVVALFAARPEPPLVSIILAVAGQTVPGCAGKVLRIRMTLAAFDFEMPIEQRKLR